MPIIGNNQPISARGHFQAANDFTPGELPLAGEIRVDHAFVKGPPLGILRGVRFITAVLVRQEDNVNAIVVCRERFDLEVTMPGRMIPKNMAFPISE